MNNLKILFVINSLKEKSGIERVAIGLANQLKEKQDNISITIANRDTELIECAYPTSNGVEILPLRGGLISFLYKLQKNITSENYNYVVIHNMGRLSLACTLLKRPKKTKLISLEHGAFDSRPSSIRAFSKILYHRLDQIVCLTTHDYNSLKKIHSNICIIPNFSPFILPSNYKFSPTKVIVAIGRLTAEKNFLHLLSAWHIASKYIPSWSLEIYGDGELQKELQETIVNKNINNINIMGSITNIDSVYKNASFIVMSSKNEGLPMVLIEAQTFGLPIVSYNCPHGPKEIINHGTNGFLVENQNPNALAEHIIKLASSESLLHEMSCASLHAAKKYQPEKILDQWINDVFTK